MPLNIWLRGTLLGIAVGLLCVFVIAIRLDPYMPTGEARTMETHRQLGLPPCTFMVMTKIPCPSCGMTTSFALLIRGDVINSARANFVGTMLATFCLAFIPWSIACVVKGRSYFVVSMERTLIWLMIGFLILLLGRWLVVLSIHWLG